MKNNVSQGALQKQLTPMKRRWLDSAEAAAYLGCSKNFLDKDRIQLRRIPFTRLGRLVKYDIHDLDAFLADAKVAPAEAC